MRAPNPVFSVLRAALAVSFASALVILVGIGQATPASAADVAVSINGFAFSPATLTVPVGTRVVWTNNQMGIPHTVTSDTGVFASPRFMTGGTFSYTFNQAGTFTYFCEVHPNMKATIIVQGGQPATTVQPTTAAGNTVATRPAATGTGGGVATSAATATRAATTAATATRPVVTATRPATGGGVVATARPATMPAAMPRTGAGGTATSFVEEGTTGSTNWLLLAGGALLAGAAGAGALRLRRARA